MSAPAEGAFEKTAALLRMRARQGFPFSGPILTAQTERKLKAFSFFNFLPDLRYNNSMKNITILGAGSFGRAVCGLLERKGYAPRLWSREDDIREYVSGADCAIFAVPSQAFREVYTKAAPYLREDALVIDLAKGIERGSLLRLSEVAAEVKPCHYVALSGPSHAEEIEKDLPTTVAVCSAKLQFALDAQELLMTDRFRVYTNDDMIGVELGGALKNIIALGAGVSDGLGLGDNAKAALMTRGMAEISRLGIALGARPETFLGLTGIGDLIVTCTSMHSRNRRCGILMGQGVPAEEAAARIGMVVEGIPAALAARDLAHRAGVEMPITEAACALIEGRTTAKEAMTALMTRDRKAE